MISYNSDDISIELKNKKLSVYLNHTLTLFSTSRFKAKYTLFKTLCMTLFDCVLLDYPSHDV